VTALPKPGKDPKPPQNLRPISLLPTTGKLFEKVILRIIRRHIEGNNLLNPCQFGFPARHSTTLQCMRVADHVTFNCNNDMSTAEVFSDIEKAFDTTWHCGLLYKLSELHFSPSLLKLITHSFPTENSDLYLTVNCPPPEICRQECRKAPSYPLLYTVCI
jgi:hypothetical protein